MKVFDNSKITKEKIIKIELDRNDLLEMLYKGSAPVRREIDKVENPDKIEIYVPCPSGGDCSGMDIEIGRHSNLVVLIKKTTVESS